MDGSIADSNSLRLRTQLQRVHWPSATSPQQELFDQLLHMPVSQAAIQSPTRRSEPDEVSDPSDTTSQPVAEQSEDQPVVADQSYESEEENTAPTPDFAICLTGCYAPIQTVSANEAHEQASEPVVDSFDATKQLVEDGVPTVAPLPIQQTDAATGVQIEAAGPDQIATIEQTSLTDPEQANAVTVPAVLHPGSITNNPRGGRGGKETSHPTTLAAPAPAVSAVPGQPAGAQADDHPSPRVRAVAEVRPVEANQAAKASPERPTGKQREKWYSTEDFRQTDPHDGQYLPETLSGEAGNDIDAAVNLQQASDASLSSSPQPAIDYAALNASTAATTLSSEALTASISASLALPGGTTSSPSGLSTSSHSESGNRPAGTGAVRIEGGQASNSTATTVGAQGRAVGAEAKAAREKRSDDVPALSQQERVRLVQRVARSFSRLGPDGGQVTLKLHPPQLGVLNVSIKMDGHTMSARLQTESAAARDVIVENLPQLRQRLSEQGIEVEQFQVDIASGDAATGSNWSMSGSNSGGADARPDSSSTWIEHRMSRRTTPTDARLASPATTRPAMPAWQATDRSLDVHV